MGEVRHFAKNTGFLMIGQFGTKILSFLLVPLYTSVLSTEEYGSFDFVNSTVALLVPLLTLNICDSALRFSIDKKADKDNIFTVSIYYFLISIAACALLLGINYILNIVSILKEYSIYTLLMFASISLCGILNCFARGIDKMKDVAISGVISSSVMIALNILFLLVFNLKLDGFFLAFIIGGFAQCIYLALSTKCFVFLKLRITNKVLQSEMVGFSKPMIVNNVSWWINNVSSRYVIVWLCGLSANGIFSVAYKIPSILVMFQGIFNQAWTVSAVQDFDKDDSNGFFTNLYNSYNVFMVLCCSITITLSKPIASILYANDFFVAWKYAPLLLISSLFGALSGYLGGIFAAVKDTKVFAVTTTYGAMINILATLVLVPFFDVMGAAIASALSFFVVWLLRVLKVRHYIKIRISFIKDTLSYFLLIIQTVVLLYSNDSYMYYIEFVLFGLLLFLNSGQIINVLMKTKKIIRK